MPSVLLFLACLLCTNLVFAEKAERPKTSTAQTADVIETNSGTKISLTDSHGKWTFAAPPQRVAIINWTLTEQILELGVKPVAIADIRGFQQTAPQTAVPDGIEDIGSRFAPSLKKLAQAEPELIIIGYSQRDLLRPLSNIAPVMYFNNFSRRYDNLKKADERFLVLAKLFDKTDHAKAKLHSRDQNIKTLKARLQQHFQQQLPAITIASPQGSDAWVFLENSMPYAVAQELGFTAELSEKPTKLGAHKRRQQQLHTLDGCILWLNQASEEKPNQTQPQAEQLGKKNKCHHTLTRTHAYGGAMSRLYLAQAISSAFIDSQ